VLKTSNNENVKSPLEQECSKGAQKAQFPTARLLVFFFKLEHNPQIEPQNQNPNSCWPRVLRVPTKNGTECSGIFQVIM